jgi:hypothetical protein
MQVLCKTTESNAETRCGICGQGFVMFWERQSQAERANAMAEIQNAFRHHHRRHTGTSAHPTGGFLIPEWNGAVAASGAAILGHAPTWAL